MIETSKHWLQNRKNKLTYLMLSHCNILCSQNKISNHNKNIKNTYIELLNTEINYVVRTVVSNICWFISAKNQNSLIGLYIVIGLSIFSIAFILIFLNRTLSRSQSGKIFYFLFFFHIYSFPMTNTVNFICKTYARCSVR
jgi:hypothetical protein